MININLYITEKLKLNKDTKDVSFDDYHKETYNLVKDFFTENNYDTRSDLKFNLIVIKGDKEFRVDMYIGDRLYKKIKNVREQITNWLSEHDIKNYSCGKPYKFGSGPWQFSINFYYE